MDNDLTPPPSSFVDVLFINGPKRGEIKTLPSYCIHAGYRVYTQQEFLLNGPDPFSFCDDIVTYRFQRFGVGVDGWRATLWLGFCVEPQAWDVFNVLLSDPAKKAMTVTPIHPGDVSRP